MLGKRMRPDYELPYRRPKQRVTAGMVQRIRRANMASGPRIVGRAPPLSNYRQSRGTPTEIKYFDTGHTGQTIANVSTTTVPAYTQVSTICDVAKGDGANQRVGNKINITQITIRGGLSVARNSNTSETNIIADPGQFRVVLYQDMQCNGAVAPITSILDCALVSSNSSNAFNNLQYNGRYKILMDKFITVDNGQLVFNSDDKKFVFGGAFKFFKKHIKCDIPVTFVGDASSITNLTTNNIGILFIANEQTHHATEYRARIRYSD